MIFSSIIFLFVFLPIVLFLYFLSADRYRNYILLAFSLLFYAYGEPRAVFLMLFSIAVNYGAGLLVERFADYKKIILVADVAINLGILFYFKYLNYGVSILNTIFDNRFPQTNIALPIGISFFTFQAMSYVIDVYRGDAVAEKNLCNVGLYVSFFPQLVAGPIVRYGTIAQQIKVRQVTVDKFGKGVSRFARGFAKKIILANNLALLADGAFLYVDQANLPLSLAWIGSIAYSLQIFFDFSGYSDMAIGLGRMFGFDIPENFNYPYIAGSLNDFWRRWHISLSQWFRDYVYIPLGGNRVKVSRNILNLFIVWALTGLWHGANITFVVWGLMYFVMLIFEKYVFKPDNKGAAVKVLWRIVTLLIVNFGWVLFKAESFERAAMMYRAMFGRTHIICDDITLGLIDEYKWFVVLGVIVSMPFIAKFEALLSKTRGKAVADVLSVVCELILLVISISYLVLGAHNPFIYFNF